MDTETLTNLLAQGEPVLVLDVRPAEQREEWHIPGSVHVDAYEALKRNDPDALAGVDLPDDALIVTVCAAGKTSRVAAEQLRLRGKRAVSLDGGMQAWSLAANLAEVPLRNPSTRVIQVRRTGKGCLSYLIGSGGEAAVIDASLPPGAYERLAEEQGWQITRVLETHLHADHLSRSKALAEGAGARLLLPEQDRAAYAFDPVRDGDLFLISEARLRALRTPGHTPESTTYLLNDEALFTGDTLFIDGVGRPDLETHAEGARRRSKALYGSLQRLLRYAPPGAVVLPGHTSRPVAFDGKPVADTLAAVQGRVAMLSLPEDAFVERLLDRLPPTPPNYERIVRMNEAGAEAPDTVLELEAGANRCAVA